MWWVFFKQGLEMHFQVFGQHGRPVQAAAVLTVSDPWLKVASAAIGLVLTAPLVPRASCGGVCTATMAGT